MNNLLIGIVPSNLFFYDNTYGKNVQCFKIKKFECKRKFLDGYAYNRGKDNMENIWQ